METIQAKAVKICGAATLVVVLIASMTMGAQVLGISWLPSVRIGMGLAVLVALTGFIVANTPRPRIAARVSVSAVGVIAVFLALAVSEMIGIPSTAQVHTGSSIVDGMLVLGLLAMLIDLCRFVLRQSALASAT